MKIQHTFIYFTSLILVLLFSSSLQAQNDSIVNDSIRYTQKYGLRLGGDLSKLARTIIDDDYSGFEINGDYRLSKNLYIAGELGTEDKTTDSEYLNSTAKGSYFKAGVDYNLYQNWFGMENMIYSGFRVGVGSFSQTINSYSIYDPYGQPWLSGNEPITKTDGTKYSGLTATWGELIIGLKAETLNNLYIGLNVQLKGRITEKEPDGFENLYIPGFGRTYDSGRFGIGFGYNISYLIPIFKKGKNTLQKD